MSFTPGDRVTTMLQASFHVVTGSPLPVGTVTRIEPDGRVTVERDGLVETFDPNALVEVQEGP